MERLLHGTIFYPQTNTDPERLQRAKNLGLHEITSDCTMVQDATPLFQGHDQPRQYCLGEKDWVEWDDSEEKTMGRHIELARDAGIDFFLINTYEGMINGVKHRELHKPIETFKKLQHPLGFASLVVLGRPRIFLPLKLEHNFEEPGRYYDIDVSTVHSIIDTHASEYWSDHRHTEINGRPFMAVMFPMGIHNQIVLQPHLAHNFINEMREYSTLTYGVNPYISGVLVGNKSREASQQYLAEAGVDALTGYAFLPNFGTENPFIQNYKTLMHERFADWDEIHAKTPHIPFSPPTVVGWDASARGTRAVAQEHIRKRIEQEKIYPFHPIVEGHDPQLFAEMLKTSLAFVKEHSPQGEQMDIICAWNEIGEGAALLDRVIEGEVDSSYRNALRTVIEEQALTDY